MSVGIDATPVNRYICAKIVDLIPSYTVISHFENFRANFKKFRTICEFQDISEQVLKFQEFQDTLRPAFIFTFASVLK